MKTVRVEFVFVSFAVSPAVGSGAVCITSGFGIRICDCDSACIRMRWYQSIRSYR